jgi:hypothetical protein
MTSRHGSRLYPVAPGLYARSQVGYDQWQSLNPDERASYVEAASPIRPEGHDATQQGLAGRAQSA